MGQSFVVLENIVIAGRAHSVGETVKLSERAAQYLVLNGQLGRVVEREPSETDISHPEPDSQNKKKPAK